MRAERITRSELARPRGLQENAVRRLLDLALATFGRRLEVRVLEPA
jgi:hypothetical protein